MDDNVERLCIPGLRGPVEVVVDRWGIPHVFAEHDDDAFLGQGFCAARDRLWQIDLWRKRRLGLLARDFGPAYLELDRAARLLLYRGDMEAEWRAYGPDAKRWTAAFVAGINAYVARVRASPERLPVEFLLTGTQPDEWAAEDVVRPRTHARVRNLESEVQRAGIVARCGLDGARMHKRFEPEWELRIPDGWQPEVVPDEVLRTYVNGTAAASFDPERVAPVLDEPPGALDGSNNWAVSPARSATGRPILATDPHRVHQMPSLRYISHLHAPGLDVIGSGEPCVPGISLGHNADIAFGLTIFPADQEDLYVYDLHPDDPTRYRYGDGWEPMRIVAERVPVRGADPAAVELAFTRHGPVLHVDADRGRAYGLRTAWTEPGTAPYLASLAYQKARDWPSFEAALEGWGAPTVNHVYADTAGNVGWVTAGRIPVRETSDGLLPVPGDGRHEWRGFLPASAHPRELNPARGWVASANHMNLPADFDHATHRTGFEFADPSRFRRIREVLDGTALHGMEEAMRLQCDVTSLTARDTLALLEGLRGADAAQRGALEMLRGWDHVLGVDSAPGALFQVWLERHLFPAVIERLAPPEVLAAITFPDVALVIDALSRPDPGFGADAAAARDALLLETLGAAFDETAERLGDDPAGWEWGRLHRAHFRHPLSALAGPRLAARLDVGPIARGGSPLTVNNNGGPIGDLRVAHGATWRMIADVGDWDASLTVNAPGQSGDPRSPHYRDLAEVWAADRYVPLLYSREAIEAAAGSRTILEPARAVVPGAGLT